MERVAVGDTPLHLAAACGDVAAVRTLLDGGAAPDVMGARGQTPLHEALGHGHRQVARILIAHGASLDIANAQGKSARDMAQAMGLWESES